MNYIKNINLLTGNENSKELLPRKLFQKKQAYISLNIVESIVYVKTKIINSNKN